MTNEALVLREIRSLVPTAGRSMPAVSLTLASGECIALSGPSGAGKSVLLRAIADLDESAGEAYLDGTPRSRLPGPRWRRLVALVPAEPGWWAERAGEHFDGMPTGMLARLGLEPAVGSRPVASLSTGERQRLALARALSREPRVLLLDEPTASLDPESTERVESLISELRADRGLAVIWVGHDPAQARRVAGRRGELTGEGLDLPARRTPGPASP